MKYIGAHVSVAGGVANAPLNAAAIGATAFALFTKNQRQWHSRPLEAEEIAAFKENCKKHGFSPQQILPHDSYLINLGHPDAEKREISYRSFAEELRRVRELGLVMLNFHPGSHLREITLSECLKNIAGCCDRAAEEVEGVFMVVENTAGQGSNAGFAFEQIGELLSLVKKPERMKVCIDSCHSFAAGYDFSTPEGYEWTWRQFEKYIGLEYLGGMHLNDAKGVLSSHLDRHESIGRGKIGIDAFKMFMQDKRLDNMPLILETPDDTLWAEEIGLLKSFAE